MNVVPASLVTKILSPTITGEELNVPPSMRRFRRQALHAARLAFEHPATGADVELEAPPPGDFLELVDVMRRDVGTP